MITDLLLEMFSTMFEWVNGKLPDATLPTYIETLFGTIQDGIDMISTILPLEHVFYAAAAFAALETAIATYKLANEAFKKARGSG